MLELLQANAPIVSAAASLGTLCIWAVYLQIFVGGHRRQVKPMLVINHGEERALNAHCLVTNMSREPVHIQSVVAKVKTDNHTYTAYITDAEDIRQSGIDTGWQRMTRQGPLQPGTMADMGTFDCIIAYAEANAIEAGEHFTSKLDAVAENIEITILGIYGSEDLLIGATRKFDLTKSDGRSAIRASEALTRQITRRRERRKLLKELNEQL
ncbi:hypothetical protein N7E02_07510 (plasmid) [Aliirhizobium terrae]|uniref:hypothetical protein n=1 Tax=Terrirhizobium terrae TaxID=2926709 RepID=UPI0025779646|nr:hypothetical protein [Rhizobium sp. CC-CFT758]WJH38459.1 hypothetical protein N7E02_07510 [Rhizobium sp. CC-CFT758]